MAFAVLRDPVLHNTVLHSIALYTAILRRAIAFALQHVHHAARNILDISGSSLHGRAIHRSEHGGELFGDALHREFGVHLVLRNQTFDAFRIVRVLEHKPMGVEQFGLVFAELSGDVVTQLLELSDGRVTGRAESIHLGLRVVDYAAFYGIIYGGEHADRADSNAKQAGEQSLDHRAAGKRCDHRERKDCDGEILIIAEFKGERRKVRREQDQHDNAEDSADKGIEDAIEAVQIVNATLGGPKVQLDLYGIVPEQYKERFNEIVNEHSTVVTYKGIANYNQTVSVLKNYYAMLFPTYFHGEGFAGCLIDAFFAGIPVIATDWLYNKDVVKDTENGLLVPIKNPTELAKAIIKLYQERDLAVKMAKTNVNEAKNYTAETVLEGLYSYLDS